MSNLYNLPRVIIGGTASGCGKTTITCAILGALVNKGIAVHAFKCGPDYIDPMFHSKVLGITTGNLDAFFSNSSQLCRQLINIASVCEVAVIEGVMGYYDGWCTGSVQGSTYDIATITQTPTILTINCKGKSTSVLAEIKGYTEMYSDNTIAGVILNNITKHTYNALKVAIEQEFGHSVQVLGYLPKLPDSLVLKSRHLGLVTASEILDIKSKMHELAIFAAQTIEIDKLLTVANSAPALYYNSLPSLLQKPKCPARIAIAYDDAFCFYYKENFEILEYFGAELVYFSPLHDTHLPQNIDGLYLGGGYPELYSVTLSENTTLKTEIKKAIQNGLPTIAECGGYMYLCSTIDGKEMVDIIPAHCTNSKKLSRFGYVTLQSKNCNLLCEKGETIKGHEFHYYDSTYCGKDFIAQKTNDVTWDCVVANDTLYAGFPHLAFCTNINAVKRFIEKCLRRRLHHDTACTYRD